MSTDNPPLTRFELGGSIARQPYPALRFVEAFDIHLDLIVDLDLNLVGFRVGKLSYRNTALALVSDVYQHLVAVHGDDRAMNDLAFLEGL
jgi:hypothetical protein